MDTKNWIDKAKLIISKYIKLRQDLSRRFSPSKYTILSDYGTALQSYKKYENAVYFICCRIFGTIVSAVKSCKY